MGVTYVGTIHILPLAGAFELHLREDGRCISGVVSSDITTEARAAMSGKLVYAELDESILLSCEEYDHAQEYMDAEIAMYGACASCGHACQTIFDTLCMDCEREDRESWASDEEETYGEHDDDEY